MSDTPVSVTMERDGDIAIVIVNNPPVNALSWHVRQGLAELPRPLSRSRALKARGSVHDLLRNPKLNHRPEVKGGVRAEECGAMLAAFFRERRRDN